MSTINQQTPGPIAAKVGEIIAAHRETLVAEVHGPTRADRAVERAANRRLLCAGFNLLDKTGRALNVDAAARVALAYFDQTAPERGRAMRLRAALSTLPPVTS